MTEAPIPKEIGKREKETFRNKVVELMRAPKPLGEFAQQDWVSSYRKGNVIIYLLMPAPGHESEDSQADCFSASVRQPLFVVEDTYFVFKEEEIKLYPNLEKEKGGSFSYTEEILVFDKEGKRIPGNPPDRKRARSIEEMEDPEYIETKLEELKQRYADEQALGMRVVTPTRYEAMMKLLNSLTPEDEIVES